MSPARICAICGASAEEVEDCTALGFTGLNRCSDCAALREFTKHEGMEAEWSGDFTRALARFERALSIARAHDLVQVSIPSSWFLGKALCCVGRYGESLKVLQDAVDEIKNSCDNFIPPG